MAAGNLLLTDVGHLRLLQCVLNEVLNGFAINDFDAVIGMSRLELEQVLVHLNALSDNAGLIFDRRQAKAFRNALIKTMHELGVEEFHTRTGFDLEEGKEFLTQLNFLIAI